MCDATIMTISNDHFHSQIFFRDPSSLWDNPKSKLLDAVGGLCNALLHGSLEGLILIGQS